MKKRRRQEGKTDYKQRLGLLKSGKRIIFRKSNRYVIGQLVESKEAMDKVILGVHSRELLQYGWPETYNVKSLPACYLTGKILGKRILEKYGKQDVILDIGLLRKVPRGRIFAFAQGVRESGINVKIGEGQFPEKERMNGMHLRKEMRTVINTVLGRIEHD